MVRHKFVCFDCRLSFKRRPFSKKYPGECPSCRNPLVYVGRSARIPKKTKVKAWAKFRERFYETRRRSALFADKWYVREYHRKEKMRAEREAKGES